MKVLKDSLIGLSEPLDFPKRYPAHFEQQPAVSETAEVCLHS